MRNEGQEARGLSTGIRSPECRFTTAPWNPHVKGRAILTVSDDFTTEMSVLGQQAWIQNASQQDILRSEDHRRRQRPPANRLLRVRHYLYRLPDTVTGCE